MNGFSSPLGVFDSGFGGLSVSKALRQCFPLDFIYLGDNAHAPYGNLPNAEVEANTYRSIATLFEQGCRCVVVACNTASTVLPKIEKKLAYYYPGHSIIDIISPTVCEIQRLGIQRLGIMATQRTVASGMYSAALPQVRVTQVACPYLASLVEDGIAHTQYAHSVIRTAIKSLFHQDPDIEAMLLGCTHYPLILDQIRPFVPEGIRILTQEKMVTDAVAQWIGQHPNLCSTNGTCQLITTGNSESFNAFARQLLYSDSQAKPEIPWLLKNAS